MNNTHKRYKELLERAKRGKNLDKLREMRDRVENLLAHVKYVHKKFDAMFHSCPDRYTGPSIRRYITEKWGSRVWW